jgi:ATP-binding cassette subfamily F protein 3
VLWDHVAFQVKRGERVGVIGPNGAGKTTLLECLLGRRDADEGDVRWGANLNIGYYDQKLGVEEFDPDASVMDEVLGDRRVSGQQLRDTLALMLFRGEDVYKQMGMLSGGERARVRLAQLLLDRPNVLVLDEPTNHLDIASREALEGALSGFEGTIFCVSHDRYFLDKVVRRLLLLSPPNVQDVEGNYSAWQGKVRAEEDARQEKEKRSRPGESAKPQAAPKKESRRDNPYLRPFGRLSLAELEAQITDTEVALAECQEMFADGETLKDAGKAAKVRTEYEALTKKLEQLEEEYYARET